MIDLDGVMVPDEGLRTPRKQTSLISPLPVNRS